MLFQKYNFTADMRHEWKNDRRWWGGKSSLTLAVQPFM